LDTKGNFAKKGSGIFGGSKTKNGCGIFGGGCMGK
jgi:hypothetical protein